MWRIINSFIELPVVLAIFARSFKGFHSFDRPDEASEAQFKESEAQLRSKAIGEEMAEWLDHHRLQHYAARVTRVAGGYARHFIAQTARPFHELCLRCLQQRGAKRPAVSHEREH